MRTKDAQLVWNRLNGIVCLYKPSQLPFTKVRETLLTKLTGELNEMECRPQKAHVKIVGDTSEQLTVDVHGSYADHPLAVGPRYIPTEMKAISVKSLSSLTSGVCVMGINRGTSTASNLRKANLVSTYRITGQLGLLTADKKANGKILYRCRSKHIHRLSIDKTVASLEAAQKKAIFSLTGIHPQSQAAYEMLSEGVCRPVETKFPIVYSLKCIEFNEPYFTLEVVSANEHEEFLLDLVGQIGSDLRNVAVTTSIQCTRCGYFSLEDALLKKHWTLQNVIDNMARCNKILNSNDEFSAYLKQVEKEEIAQINAHENDMLEENSEYEEKQLNNI